MAPPHEVWCARLHEERGCEWGGASPDQEMGGGAHAVERADSVPAVQLRLVLSDAWPIYRTTAGPPDVGMMRRLTVLGQCSAPQKFLSPLRESFDTCDERATEREPGRTWAARTPSRSVRRRDRTQLCAGAVRWRTTSSMAISRPNCGTHSPRPRAKANSTTAAAMSHDGCRTVVSGGSARTATSVSPKPTRDRFRRCRCPQDRSACSARPGRPGGPGVRGRPGRREPRTSGWGCRRWRSG